MFRSLMYKSMIMMKLGGLVAKLSVIFSIISTIATLFHDIGAEMGGVIDIACVVSYMGAIAVSGYSSYDRTAHIPPAQTK